MPCCTAPCLYKLRLDMLRLDMLRPHNPERNLTRPHSALAPLLQSLPASMTSLPIPICPPEAAAHIVDQTRGEVHGNSETRSGDRVAGDEQFLLAAFHSFSEAAASLERSYGNLRAEVERLRAELDQTHQKLQREQALSEMSAVLAHEVRNPLASLELFAGLLAEADLNAECRRWVEHVQAGLRTLAATVNNVLHFHTLPEPDVPEPDAPEQDFCRYRPASEFAPVDLGRLLEWARDFLLPLARQAGVALGLQNRLLGVELPADRHRMEQVLLNLVLNAIRALPDGGWIELGGHVLREENAVELFVADTGPGISAAELPHIFEPGFSTRSGSAGLGLAVCRRIVALHQGTITAATHPNGGALFTLQFPLPGTLAEHRELPKHREADHRETASAPAEAGVRP
jgi:signal transduction histidine kinase